jgi:uncharacterized coiled-coil protein SlyX
MKGKMKKNDMKNKNSNFVKTFGLLIIGLFLIIIVFGGLSINSLQNQNKKLEASQTRLENQITDLENNVALNQTQISTLSDDLSKNKNDLAYYKKLTYSLQQKINDSVASNNNTSAIIPAIATKATVKKVTNTVYVKAPVAHETSVTVQGVGSYKVDVASGDNAFTSLKKASKIGGFPIDYQSYSYGVFITSIGGQMATGNQYWAFYYNGNYSNVGASDQKISDNDTTFWRLESF